MIECIIVGAGGWIGAVCRYLIGLIPLGDQSVFPLKTFLINVAGSFVIGVIAALAWKSRPLNPRLVLFLKTGVCGGFTTFSSFALETEELIKNGNMPMALLYACLSMAGGILAAAAGQKLAG